MKLNDDEEERGYLEGPPIDAAYVGPETHELCELLGELRPLVRRQDLEDDGQPAGQLVLAVEGVGSLEPDEVGGVRGLRGLVRGVGGRGVVGAPPHRLPDVGGLGVDRQGADPETLGGRGTHTEFGLDPLVHVDEELPEVGAVVPVLVLALATQLGKLDVKLVGAGVVHCTGVLAWGGRGGQGSGSGIKIRDERLGIEYIPQKLRNNYTF